MEAITREEKIMSGENLTPITRKEMFLAKAAGQDVETPTPITREEMFLSNISGGGSSGGGENKLNQLFTKTITDVTVADLQGATKIENYAFSNCTGLTSIVIPDSVTSIGSSAFFNCTGLTSVTIGKSVTSLGDYAFRNCTGLKELHIRDIGAWCKVSFGMAASPLATATELYLDEQLIIDLIIPNTVTAINPSTFYCCKYIENIVIPDSVTSIGRDAFNACSALTNVTIGSGITNIELQAFYNLSKLKTFRIYATTPPTISSSTFYFAGANPRIEVPSESVEAYKTATNWSSFASKIVAIEE